MAVGSDPATDGWRSRVVRLWSPPVAAGVCALLCVVVVVQGVLLSRLDDRVDRMASETAEQRRYHERRIGQLEDRTDALTDRVRRSLNSAAIARHAVPSVLRVVAGKSSGTAFALAHDGDGTYLVTNNHVVAKRPIGAQTVRVSRDGADYQAEVVKADSDHDVAILRVARKLPVLRPTIESVAPGEPVLVVGAPVGLEDTVTTGVVSKIRPVAGRQQDYIQFDAAINPGNSGGPVLNAAGRVVGIATAKQVDAEGIGFALPIGVACDSFDSIC